jgi:hypothetical protein
MNPRRIVALERQLGAGDEPRCGCLLTYRVGQPAPARTGTCPDCGRPRTGKNIRIRVVVIKSREEYEALHAAKRERSQRAKQD